MAVTISNVNDSDKSKFENGRSFVQAELFVDTVGELPAPDGLDGYQLLQGSVAYVIDGGKLAVLSGGGEWYVDGEAI